MRLVVDASTLVAELMRERGRRLFRRRELQLLISERAWDEATRGLGDRAKALSRKLAPAEVDELLAAAFALVRERFFILPQALYADYEAVARTRVRDESDWPTVAAALATSAAILTSDPDFLGSGVPTWTYESLTAELERGAAPGGT